MIQPSDLTGDLAADLKRAGVARECDLAAHMSATERVGLVHSASAGQQEAHKWPKPGQPDES